MRHFSVTCGNRTVSIPAILLYELGLEDTGSLEELRPLRRDLQILVHQPVYEDAARAFLDLIDNACEGITWQ